MLRRKWFAGLLLVIACVGFAILMATTKTGFVPNEDMGTVFVDVRTSPGNSVSQTRKVMEQVDSCLRTIPQIELQSNTTGNSTLSGQVPATECSRYVLKIGVCVLARRMLWML